MKLKKGDVFTLENGKCVYGKIPEKFLEHNPARQSNTPKNTEIQIGYPYSTLGDFDGFLRYRIKEMYDVLSENWIDIDRYRLLDFVLNNVIRPPEDFFTLKSDTEFVVVKTTFDGGGQGNDKHEIYPDGHHIFAKALKDGEYDENGMEINFYQSGCFTCQHPHIAPIRRIPNLNKYINRPLTEEEKKQQRTSKAIEKAIKQQEKTKKQ